MLQVVQAIVNKKGWEISAYTFFLITVCTIFVLKRSVNSSDFLYVSSLFGFASLAYTASEPDVTRTSFIYYEFKYNGWRSVLSFSMIKFIHSSDLTHVHLFSKIVKCVFSWFRYYYFNLTFLFTRSYKVFASVLSKVMKFSTLRKYSTSSYIQTHRRQSL